MAKVLQGVRFEPEEIQVINEYVEFTGSNFSEVVRGLTMLALEDELDTAELKEAIASSAGEFHSFHDVKKELLA